MAKLLPALAAALALFCGATQVQTQAQAAEKLELLAYGDSLVHGYGLPSPDNFPAQLQDALAAAGREVEVINAGNSGDTSAAGLARLDWALSEMPDAAIVVLGANDALRGLDPAKTYENLDALLGRFAEMEVPVLLAGMMAPRNLGPEYAEEFDGLYARLAEKHDVVFYPFFLDGVATNPDLNQPDGIHPNAAGVAEIVERILPKVQDLLAAADNGRG
ncbi:MAG: arylesterase [Rhodovibrionaceae bacterium]